MLYLGLKKVVAKSGTTLYIVLQLFLPCNTPVCCIRQVWFVNGKTRNIAILNRSAAMLSSDFFWLSTLYRSFRSHSSWLLISQCVLAVFVCVGAAIKERKSYTQMKRNQSSI